MRFFPVLSYDDLVEAHPAEQVAHVGDEGLTVVYHKDIFTLSHIYQHIHRGGLMSRKPQDDYGI
jgi:hypothetical protein